MVLGSLIFIILILIYAQVIKINLNISEIIKSKPENRNIGFVLALALMFFIFALFSPQIILSKTVLNYLALKKDSNIVGDTLGGIMNPFIAITGICLTFLAFYIQYIANKQVQNQFEIQKFESQFYEMLRIHREDVNDWKYKSSISERGDMYNGRIVSVEIFKQFIELKKEIEHYNRKAKIHITSYLSIDYKNKVNSLFGMLESDVVIVELIYIILFYGHRHCAKRYKGFVVDC